MGHPHSRAERRAHLQRIKHNRRHYWGDAASEICNTSEWVGGLKQTQWTGLYDGRMLGLIAGTPKTQCHCCRNPRKELGQITRKERMAQLDPCCL